MFYTAVLVFGENQLICFKSEDSQYFLSQTQVANLMNVGESAIRKFFNSRNLDGISYFDNENHTTVLLRNLDQITEYFIYQNQKGNKIAQKIVNLLVRETLTLRAEKAFGTLTLEKTITTLEYTQDALITALRMNAKDLHNSFQRACYGSKMNPSAVHNRITKLVFGYDAKEARELPMTDLKDDIWLNEAVGINHEHTKNVELMKVYQDVKNKIFSYRKGSWEEKVDRAYKEVTNK
jgi:hypothetical protein